MTLEVDFIKSLYILAGERLCVMCNKALWFKPEEQCSQYLHTKAYPFLVEVRDFLSTKVERK